MPPHTARPWLKIFDGLAGHLLGAIIITFGLGSVVLSIWSPSSKQLTMKICITKLGNLATNPQADIYLRKVKLGAGPNEASGPYWEEDKLMTGTREASADLTYPEGGGAQFKIFVMFKQIVSENNINECKKLLKTEN
jgi:hypothetical protein